MQMEQCTKKKVQEMIPYWPEIRPLYANASREENTAANQHVMDSMCRAALWIIIVASSETPYHPVCPMLALKRGYHAEHFS